MFNAWKSFQSLSLVHWVVISLSLLLTLTAWQVSSRIAEEKAREQFDHQVKQLNELLRDRMQKYEFALMSGAGAIRASEGGVNLEMWKRFSEVLAVQERLPGINGIGVIERVAAENLSDYIAEEQQERSYFRVHPSHGGDDFWPIVYIEPEASNNAAVGLDMAHESNRYQAALKAMRTGQTQITGPIVLVQDEEKTPGFLFFRPFYQSAEVPPADQRESLFSGLVYAPFTMSKLMEGTLANVNRLVHFRVTDGESRLYSELDETRGDNYDPTPMFETSYVMDMYGRQWHFDVQTTLRFETFNAGKQPIIILVSGLVINALIFLVFALMANARRRAESKVVEKTAELQESLNFINTLTDHLPLTVSVWDSRLTCRFMNAYGEHWFPFSKETAIGQNLEQMLGPDLVKERSKHYRQALEGKSVQASASLENRKGEIRDVVVSYHPVTLQGERCFMATTIDVTDIVQREKELEVLNAELEEQKQEAESAVTVKTAFLANMSHEIRTPMNAIIGVLVLLQEAGLEDHPRRLVKKAFSASEALLQLLNDILDLSKIEADHIELDIHPFDIDALVHRSVDLFAIVAEEKGLKLRVSIDPATPNRVSGDLLRISQICTNLVGNAVKFTRKGGIDVRIDYRTESQASGYLQIEVVDTGVGIKPEDQGRIFENFRQADESTSRNFGGTGLGLAISQRLALLMKAELNLESDIGKGSTFRLLVPVGVSQDDGTVSSSRTGRPIHVFHYGFRANLALLEDYREHWRLTLETVDDMTQWPAILESIAKVEDVEDRFFLIDMEGTEPSLLDGFVTELLTDPGRYPLWAILIIAPAGYWREWVADFERSGGHMAFEPLTPSKLFEHFSQRHGNTPDLRGGGKPQFDGLSALVVDDVPLNCEIVESYLRSFGVNVQSVQTGGQAVERLGQRGFDLILMDLHLDGETGQEVTERIHGCVNANDSIIVALSASISDHDRMTAKAAGMQDYLTKPVVPKDIQLLLETYFEDRRSVVYTPEVSDESEVSDDTEVAVTDMPDFISRQAYDRLFSDDQALFTRCVRSFIASSAEMVADVRKATLAEDARHMAHKIKGAAASIADTELAQVAGLIENAQEDHTSLSILPQLLNLLLEHSRRLEQHFGLIASGDNVAETDAELQIVLSRVKTKLGGNRIAEDEDLRVILNHLIASGEMKLANQLRQALEVYDFPLALALLDDVPLEG
ncbi:CHASE domain-containing protein [Marinobacter salarius]|jgi:PAS domain S-box-containing protein|nr:CHASE domain-containing protein [Marinobacter salarius]